MKAKSILFTVALSSLLASCSVIYVGVTDNPVGTKTGTAEGWKNATIGNAAKDGDIEKIGTVKYQFRGAKSVVKVTGE